MDYEQLVRPSVLTQPVYEPGKPIEDVARELGLDPAGIIKLASNENPHGPSPLALAAASRALSESQLYPDGGCFALRQKLSEKTGMKSSQIIVGNGSNEILELIARAFLCPGDEVVMGNPSFIVYKLMTLVMDARPVEVPLVNHTHVLSQLRAAVTPRTKLVVLPSPNNPTGTANTEAEIFTFVRSLPDHVIFVFDGAYAEFLDNPPDLRPLIAEGRKVICLHTFSKIYGLASLRLGYGYAAESMITLINRVRQPFNANAIAQAAGLAALDDTGFVERCREANRLGLVQLYDGFKKLGLEYVPSEANFIVVKVGDGAAVFDALQRRGVIVRPMKAYGMPSWLRITVGTEQQNVRLLQTLAGIVGRPH